MPGVLQVLLKNFDRLNGQCYENKWVFGRSVLQSFPLGHLHSITKLGLEPSRKECGPNNFARVN